MKTYKLTIEYDGTDFNGWQIQGQNNRTVQAEIERALEHIAKKRVHVLASGRTDSGVHAKGQVAHFRSAAIRLNCQDLLRALNANLPDDVSILNVEEVPKNFHAQFDVKRKTYRYTILNRVAPSSLERHVCLHIPYKLNLSKMRQAAVILQGRHDFRSFMASDPAQRATVAKKNTVRQIFSFNIRKKGPFILIDVESNGFLYKMVRNLIGTLLFVGSGKILPGQVSNILKSKDRALAGDTAPAYGLCLLEVIY